MRVGILGPGPMGGQLGMPREWGPRWHPTSDMIANARAFGLPGG